MRATEWSIDILGLMVDPLWSSGGDTCVVHFFRPFLPPLALRFELVRRMAARFACFHMVHCPAEMHHCEWESPSAPARFVFAKLPLGSGGKGCYSRSWFQRVLNRSSRTLLKSIAKLHALL